jgi:hypothetical protein
MRLPLYRRGVLLLMPLFIIPGCHDPVANLDTDKAFLRQPGDPLQGVAIGSGPLLPAIKGATFDMGVLVTNAQGPQKPLREQIVVAGVKKAGEQTRVTLETRRNGKVTRREVFVSDAEGLKMAAAGLGDSVSITPPLPLIRYPVKEGDVISWNGILKFRGTSAPGTAYSRVSGQDMVRDGKRQVGAYRVDTLIETTIAGRLVPFMTTRWFAPSVGIAHQWNYGSDAFIERILIARRVP